jgi:hypothetical protein
MDKIAAPDWTFLDDRYTQFPSPVIGETCVLPYTKPLVLLGAAVIVLALIGYGFQKVLHGR